MKKILFGLLVCWMSTNFAMAEARWLTSLPVAQELAKKENKLIMMDFTGSDWCEWCKKLEAEVFSKPDFESYANTNLVLVQVDFPIQKPQTDALKATNKALQTKYNVDGYPTVIVVKPDGTVVWQHTGYLDGGLPAYIAAFNKAKMSETRS